MRNEGGNGVQSVSRALRILELMADPPAELGVSELGRLLGVHKATASRLLATLAEHNLVERSPLTDKYRLGFGLVHLAGSAMSELDLVRQARPMLEELAEATRETVNLGVLDRDSVVYLDQITGTRSIVSVSWVGRRTPVHCTANGKVLLAFLDEDERARLLGGRLQRLTSNTIIEPERLRAQLMEVRTQDYAHTVEELEEGLNAVAAPVRNAEGGVIAAVSVAGPAFRLRPVDIPRIARMTMDAAGAISRRMGYVERRQSVGG